MRSQNWLVRLIPILCMGILGCGDSDTAPPVVSPTPSAVPTPEPTPEPTPIWPTPIWRIPTPAPEPMKKLSEVVLPWVDERKIMIYHFNHLGGRFADIQRDNEQFAK